MDITRVAVATIALAAAMTARADGIGDPQIAAIVVTANQVDIEAGRLAQQNGSTPEVREFAGLMVKDHAAVNQAAGELVSRLGVQPEDNPTARGLKQGGEANLARLQTLSGVDFDRSYVGHEVTYHQAVLEALDRTLIPSARNGELRALMVKVRPAFVSHLQHAQHLQSSLGR